MTSKSKTTGCGASLRPADPQSQANRVSGKTDGSAKDALLTAKPLGDSRAKRRLNHTVICLLSDRWRLCGDSSQWRLEHFVAPKWRPIAFIASEKAVLTRLLWENGISLSPEAICALDHLPERFCDWRDRRIAYRNNLEKTGTPKARQKPKAIEA